MKIYKQKRFKSPQDLIDWLNEKQFHQSQIIGISDNCFDKIVYYREKDSNSNSKC